MSINTMTPNYDQELARLIQSLYPNAYVHASKLPDPHHGSAPIKAIVIGADPTWKNRPKDFDVVFGIDPQNGSRFFDPILKNLHGLGLSLDTIYVQNLVKNYFTEETSKNPVWPQCALLWLENLKRELDNLFDRSIPMLATARPILDALVYPAYVKNVESQDIYKKMITFPPEHNFFNRHIFALFRHHEYNLEKEKWQPYVAFIKNIFANESNGVSL